MRRGIFIILVAIAGAITIWGFSKFQEGRSAQQIEAIAAITDPTERIDAMIEHVEAHPNLASEYLDSAAEDIAEAVSELRDDVAVPAYIDSMLAGGLPDALVTPLLAEQHYVVLVNVYYNETAELAGNADAIGRTILERGDATAKHLLGSAYIRGAVFPAISLRWPTVLPDPWLTLELAEAGLVADGDSPDWFKPVLVNAYRPIIQTAALTRGEEAEPAFIDSLLSTAPDAAHEYALHYHRFMRMRNEDGDAAIESARALANLMGEHGDMSSLNSVGYTLAESELDPELALLLCEQSLAFASAAHDSANILDSVGWAHYHLGSFDEAESAILKAIDLTPGNPGLDDVMVTHLIEIYDAADRPDAAIDFLAPIVARSPDPSENGGDLLMQWMARAGHTQTLDELVAECRYCGVEAAPDFALTGDAGNVGLSDCAGAILVLNFWGAGCGPCRVELPRLAELSTMFEGRAVRFISITSGPDGDAAQRALAEAGVAYETFFMCSETFDAYDVAAIPTTVIIDHEGRAMYRHLGFRDGNEVGFAAEIELLLSWIPEA
ncbi:redoxin domain-containing protein [bacterium]|nr:redoxin domain-containing protein [bacterium]